MTDDQFKAGEAFAEDFKALVRRYVPHFPTTDDEMAFLYHIQDMTSCFNPYVWSDYHDPGNDS